MTLDEAQGLASLLRYAVALDVERLSKIELSDALVEMAASVFPDFDWHPAGDDLIDVTTVLR